MSTVVYFLHALLLDVGGFIWLVKYWGEDEILLAMPFFGLAALLLRATDN